MVVVFCFGERRGKGVLGVWVRWMAGGRNGVRESGGILPE